MLVSGVAAEPIPCCVEEGPGSGEYLGYGHSSSRRRGDGTEGRSADPQQGRSRGQCRPGRRAKTPSIPSDPEKAPGVGETGGVGQSSEERWDNTTRSEPKTCGPWWLWLESEAEGPEKTTRAVAGGPKRDEGSIKLTAKWGM